MSYLFIVLFSTYIVTMNKKQLKYYNWGILVYDFQVWVLYLCHDVRVDHYSLRLKSGYCASHYCVSRAFPETLLIKIVLFYCIAQITCSHPFIFQQFMNSPHILSRHSTVTIILFVTSCHVIDTMILLVTYYFLKRITIWHYQYQSRTRRWCSFVYCTVMLLLSELMCT